MKKVMTLLLILMGNQLNSLMQVEYIRYGLIIAFTIDEGMSIGVETFSYHSSTERPKLIGEFL